MSSSKLYSDICGVLQVVAELEKVSMSSISADLKSTETRGFFTESYKGTIKSHDVDGGKVVSVAIRYIPKKENEVDSQYGNENNVYYSVFPILNTFQEDKTVEVLFDNIPKFYCKSSVTNEDGETMQYIAIQDITSLGYQKVDKNRPFLDNEHIKLVFRMLGRFHALSFALKDQCIDKYKEAVNSLPESIKTNYPVQLLENYFLAGLRAFDEKNDADITNKLKQAKLNIEEFNNALEYLGPYKCIIHGDCRWPNSMLFKYKDCGKLEDMKLSNFNMTRESSPIIDLSLFFYSAASKNDFKKIDEYLQFYYQSFSSFLKELGSNPDEVFPYEALLTEWKTCGIAGAHLEIGLSVSKFKDSAEYKNRVCDLLLHLIEYDMM